MQLIRFTITIPNGELPEMITLDSLCWGTIDLRVTTFSGYVGVTGGDANDFANNLKVRLNTSLEDSTLVDLRVNNSLVATVLNNVVTVEYYAESVCCGYSVEIGVSGKGPNPFIGTASNLDCPSVEEIPEVNCADYPDNTHVYRFQFVPQVGFVMGLLGTDYRYTIDSAASSIIGCRQAISIFELQSGLSTTQYSNFQDFYEGWAATLDLYWRINYGGGCRHLGSGVMEVFTSIEIWNAKLPDICSVGLTCNCNYVLYDPPINTPNFMIVDISQQCCIPTPPPPWIDPVITPPVTPDYNTDVEPFCYEYSGFDCCLLGAGGIDTIYISNWAFYRPENPDFVTFGQYGITNDLLGKITSITLLDNIWYQLCVKGNLIIEQANSGFLHNLECTVPVMTFGNRIMLQQLIWKGLIVIVKDMNGRYWFLGEDAPMRPSNIKSTTGGETSVNTFSMSAMQGCIAREIYESVIPTLNINVFEDCGNYVGQPLGTYSLWKLRNCILWDMRNNNLV